MRDEQVNMRCNTAIAYLCLINCALPVDEAAG